VTGSSGEKGKAIILVEARDKRMITQAGDELEAQLENATSDVQKIKLLEEIKALEAEQAGLVQAQESEDEAKSYSKRNKATTYEKGKGSKVKKVKKSK
jgi:superfamily II DNA/RNA helicase